MKHRHFAWVLNLDAELELESAKGRRMWVRAIGEAVRSDDGTIVAVQGAFQDISRSKEGQAEVSRLATRLSSALDSMTDAFFTLDRGWRFTYLNKQAHELLTAQAPRPQRPPPADVREPRNARRIHRHRTRCRRDRHHRRSTRRVSTPTTWSRTGSPTSSSTSAAMLRVS